MAARARFVKMGLPEKVREDPWISRARASSHHKSIQRRESMMVSMLTPPRIAASERVGDYDRDGFPDQRYIRVRTPRTARRTFIPCSWHWHSSIGRPPQELRNAVISLLNRS